MAVLHRIGARVAAPPSGTAPPPGSEILDVGGWQVVVTDGHAVLPEGMTHLPCCAFDATRPSNAMLYTSLVSVACPSSLVSIGSWAFDGCSALTSVTLLDSLTSIGDGAFFDCPLDAELQAAVRAINIWAMRLPIDAQGHATVREGVAWLPSTIAHRAFDGCSSLTAVTLPDSLTSLSYSAFRACSALTAVTLPNSLTSIPNSAFDGCSSLVTIALPDSLISIGDWAFRDCSALTAVTLPDSLISIGKRAFHGCTSLVSVACPRSLASIDVSAFSECSSLVSIAFPATITSISSFAFYGCTSLASATFPASLIFIDRSAFCRCSSLSSVTFPAGLTSIGGDAFFRCSALARAAFPAGLTSIADDAFDHCSALAHVAVPTTATISPHAFQPATTVLRLPPAKMRWYDAVAFALAYKRCRPLLYGWLERAQTRLGSYGPDGAARQRDREEFEGDFAHLALHAD